VRLPHDPAKTHASFDVAREMAAIGNMDANGQGLFRVEPHGSRVRVEAGPQALPAPTASPIAR
jgi:hypothetical protein